MSISLKGLNKEQKEAVTTESKNTLVVATAGSGKTSVLTYRAAQLISKGVLPNRLLLLTFTVKASEEMMTRIVDLVGFDGEEVKGGTFHSFGYRLLRKYASKLGIHRDFVVVNPKDSENLLSQVIYNLPCKPKTFINLLSFRSNTGKSWDDLLVGDKSYLKDNIKVLEDSEEEFRKFKRDNSILDYDDLLLFTYELLTKTDVPSKLLYKHILVDEYQDCNFIQVEIIKELAKHASIFVVGDQNQSVYSFRGADCSFIQSFSKEFKAKTYVLNQNYRSTQEILDLANEVGSRLQTDYDMHMFSDMTGDKPSLVYMDDTQHNKWVAESILDKLNSGVKPNEIAVLARTNSLLELLGNVLTTYNIKFYKKGGTIFDKAPIKDVMSLVNVAFYAYDPVSWSRLFRNIRGLGKKYTEKVLPDLKENGFTALLQEGVPVYCSEKSKEAIMELYNALKKVRKYKNSPEKAIAEAIEYSEAGFSRYVKVKEEDLSLLIKLSSNFETVKSFLTNITLSNDANADKDKRKKVTLSTIHLYKGLAARVVYLIGMFRDTFPSTYFADEENIDESIMEERRLFYVAITRPKKELIIVCPKDKEATSQFIIEIQNKEKLTNIVKESIKESNKKSFLEYKFNDYM